MLGATLSLVGIVGCLVRVASALKKVEQLLTAVDIGFVVDVSQVCCHGAR